MSERESQFEILRKREKEKGWQPFELPAERGNVADTLRSAMLQLAVGESCFTVNAKIRRVV